MRLSTPHLPAHSISIRWSFLAFTRMAFDFLALILRPTLAASLACLLVLSLMSTYLDDNNAMSPANSKSFKIEVNFHRIPVLLPSVVLHMIQSIASKKRKSCCFIPDLTWNHCVVSPSSKTVRSKLLYIAFINMISALLGFRTYWHHVLQTLSVYRIERFLAFLLWNGYEMGVQNCFPFVDLF